MEFAVEGLPGSNPTIFEIFRIGDVTAQGFSRPEIGPMLSCDARTVSSSVLSDWGLSALLSRVPVRGSKSTHNGDTATAIGTTNETSYSRLCHFDDFKGLNEKSTTISPIMIERRLPCAVEATQIGEELRAMHIWSIGRIPDHE
jgi:hypothetical protein